MEDKTVFSGDEHRDAFEQWAISIELYIAKYSTDRRYVSFETCMARDGRPYKGCEKRFDWTGIEKGKGMQLCSACSPTNYGDGKSCSKSGGWHEQFERAYICVPYFNEVPKRVVAGIAHKNINSVEFDAETA